MHLKTLYTGLPSLRGRQAAAESTDGDAEMTEQTGHSEAWEQWLQTSALSRKVKSCLSHTHTHTGIFPNYNLSNQTLL